MQFTTFVSEKEKSDLVRFLPTGLRVFGISYAQLGEMIGVSRNTVSNVINGVVPCTAMHYLSIKAALDYCIAQETDRKEKAVLIYMFYHFLSDETPTRSKEILSNNILWYCGDQALCFCGKVYQKSVKVLRSWIFEQDFMALQSLKYPLKEKEVEP